MKNYFVTWSASIDAESEDEALIKAGEEMENRKEWNTRTTVEHTPENED